MVIFWKRAAHSVDHMFFLYLLLFVILVISRFGFEGWNWVLIASRTLFNTSLIIVFRIKGKKGPFWFGLRLYVPVNNF